MKDSTNHKQKHNIMESQERVPKIIKEILNLMLMDMMFDDMKETIDITQFCDNTKKNVGDTVKVNHEYLTTYFRDFDTDDQLAVGYANTPKELRVKLTLSDAIVVAVDEDYTFKCGHCNKDHKADMIVYYPCIEKKYRVNSTSFKIVELKNKKS